MFPSDKCIQRNSSIPYKVSPVERRLTTSNDLLRSLQLEAQPSALPSRSFITESQNGLGKKGTIRSSSSMDKDVNHQSRLLRAPSNPSLNTSMDRAHNSLGNPFQCLTALCLQNFFLTTSLICSFVVLKLSPLVLSVPVHEKSYCSSFS